MTSCKITGLVQKTTNKQKNPVLVCSSRNNLYAVLSHTFRLTGDCPNFLETIAPKAVRRRLRALNFVPTGIREY